MTKRTQTPYQAVTSNLGKLSRPQLQEVAYMVAGLLEALEDEDQTQADQVEGAAPEVKQGARGHIEYKVINGCGPYAYLRYWSGKTLKSHYIGKAKTS